MEKEPVFQVDTVRLAMSSEIPRRLAVTADGQVASPGWSDPELRASETAIPPEDGMLELRLMAEPPPYVRMPSFYPVSATLTIEEAPAWLKGVRVIAATNQVDKLLPESAGGRGKEEQAWRQQPAKRRAA